MKKLWALFLIAALALLGCQAIDVTNSSDNGAYTGFLEGEHLDVAAEVGGRIMSVAVEEGDTVQSGEKLVTLEDDLLRARLAIADANLAAASAQLALLEHGARAEEIRRAEAQVQQARAALAAATQALADAEAIRANPQLLVIAQAQAEMRARAAAHQLIAAQRQAQAADQINQFWEIQTKGLWEGVDIPLPRGGTLHFDTPMKQQLFAQAEWQKAGLAAWEAWAGVAQAQANANLADANLKDVSDQLANPIALDTRVNQARGPRERAAAALQAVEAGLRIRRDGASAAQLQAARAAVDQARAARATLDQELARYQIAARDTATVRRVYYRAGEIALPGVPLVQLSRAGDLTLRVFVPMSELGRIRTGDSVAIRVEGIETGAFSGAVSHINDKAEFSGRQSQTDSERNAQLVAVEISIKNSNDQLKPGMPASASFK
ncbi:MAG: HlyD family efflux transporter periplasmic adaptor subunit [Chloroflexi bacterium]|nr:HlyD family efflux transporter periplasmic adaptor subunit [Chloroflexota bacterium]